MKLLSLDREVESSGLRDDKPFLIQSSAKAFQLLSSNLYRYKIRAIIRELSCNAYDAHVESGNSDKPFDVHLPNFADPYFSIRDYGTGLSHEQITSIFRTYFDSTKTTSNELTGCLGLGSKSPFAYTDNFTVISYLNGIKNSYSAYINSNGVPSIALLTSIPTDQPNGIEYIVPLVNSRDAREFLEEAQRIYQYFDILPNIIGTKNFNVNSPNYYLIGDGYKVSNSFNGSIAVMGRIAYPIDHRVFNYDEEIMSVLVNGVEMYFDIGDLDFTMGREDLSYDPITKENIVKKAKQVIDEIKSTLQTNLDTCENTYQARKMLQQISTNWRNWKFQLTYRGVYISSSTTLKFEDLVNDLEIYYISAYASSMSREKVSEIYLETNSKIIIHDLPVKERSKERIRLRNKTNSPSSRSCYIFFPANEEIRKEIITRLDGHPFILTSELPEPERKVYKTKVKVSRINVYDSKITKHDIETDKGYYIVSKNHNYIHNEMPNLSENTLKNWLLLFKKMNIFDVDKETLVRIPSTIVKKSLNENFINFEEHVKKILIENKDKIIDIINYSKITDSSSKLFNFMNSIRKDKPFSDDHLLTRLADNLKIILNYDDIVLLTKYLSSINIVVPTTVVTDWKIISGKYPLLPIVMQNTISMNNEIYNYIKLIDNSKERT